MATQVVMPKLSPTMEEGQLSRWLKKEGDKVSVGEGLAEIDTDKATMEAQALASGVLRKVLVKEGDTVPLGTVIAIIGEPDEDISGLASEASSGAAQAENKERIEDSTEGRAYGAPDEVASVVPEGRRTQATVEGKPIKGDVGGQPSTQQPQQAQSTKPESSGNGQRAQGGRLLVSPIAARMAAEAGINLHDLTGSGPNGRIVKRDIEAAMSGAPAQEERLTQGGGPTAAQNQKIQELSGAQARQTAAPQIEGAAPYHEEQVAPMRATIARRLVASLGPIPHIFLTTEIEMDRVAEMRRQLNELDPEN